MPRIAVALVLTGGAATLFGCNVMPDPEFASLERALTLRLVDVRRLESSERVEVRLQLQNAGPASARACLGPGRLVGYRPGGTHFEVTHHPGCVREFDVPPRGAPAWREAYEAPRAYNGHGEIDVELDVQVQIVNPRRCSSVGCAAFDLQSNAVRFR